MRTRFLTAATIALSVGCAAALTSCEDRAALSKAQKAEAKRARDAELLAMAYPASTGVQPQSMEISYDGARDRTTMKLRLTGMRVSGGSASQVSGAMLHLTSSHPGRVRATDNPEGSVDGSLVVQTTSPGILAYSGAPGTVTFEGQAMPLKVASGKEPYVSAKTAGGREEVRFRFQTEGLVAGAKAGSITLSFGAIQIEVAGQQLADFREFVARMNPKP